MSLKARVTVECFYKGAKWIELLFPQDCVPTFYSRLSLCRKRTPHTSPDYLSLTFTCPKIHFVDNHQKPDLDWGALGRGNGNWFRTALSRQFRIKSNMVRQKRTTDNHSTLQKTSLGLSGSISVSPHSRFHTKTLICWAKENFESGTDIWSELFSCWSVHPSAPIY